MTAVAVLVVVVAADTVTTDVAEGIAMKLEQKLVA